MIPAPPDLFRLLIDLNNWRMWEYFREADMKACKFCVFLNSYVCDNQDCIDCGQCRKEPPKKENPK